MPPFPSPTPQLRLRLPPEIDGAAAFPAPAESPISAYCFLRQSPPETDSGGGATLPALFSLFSLSHRIPFTFHLLPPPSSRGQAMTSKGNPTRVGNGQKDSWEQSGKEISKGTLAQRARRERERILKQTTERQSEQHSPMNTSIQPLRDGNIRADGQDHHAVHVPEMWRYGRFRMGKACMGILATRLPFLMALKKCFLKNWWFYVPIIAYCGTCDAPRVIKKLLALVVCLWMTKEHGFQECILEQGETPVEMKMDLLQVVNLTKENPAPHHPHRNLIEDCQICSKSSMNHTPQEGNKLSD